MILGFCARNELIVTADCVCPGRNFTYECSVVGALFTVWRGTVISAGCEVTLFHSEFDDPGAARAVCNSGAVVGYNIGVENNCYTSNLDVLVSSGLNGRTVECIMDDGVTNTLIDTATLSITTSKTVIYNTMEMIIICFFFTYIILCIHITCTCSTFSATHQCSTCNG